MTLDHNYHSMDMRYSPRNLNPHEMKIQAYKRAMNLYNRVKFRGYLWRLWRRLSGRPVAIMHLDQLRKNCKFGNCFELGLQTVPIAQVKGTVNRSEDFDGNFYPCSEHAMQRWIRVAEMLYRCETFQAVDLIQIGDRYFVEDGHHRVSTSRSLGIKFIEANVKVMKVEGTLPWVQKKDQPFRRRQLIKNT